VGGKSTRHVAPIQGARLKSAAQYPECLWLPW
jgi:hypothetical protein